ncbi:hypothetical protein ACM2KX_08210 [Escherichia coli]|nr:hypothetical protein [Escherichia coli]EJM1111806.1 hypothetical protein [Escherichia coli]EJM1524470.1 hypothetical protein [Escherichia coli]MBI1104021.1 hypothetical protein [Escherichia coli]HBK9118713.1 hypothetical protein [Escherichia coli]
MSNQDTGFALYYGASLSTSYEGWPDLSVSPDSTLTGTKQAVEGILSDEEVASLPSRIKPYICPED